jgi:two-component system sensor histidine kinase ResE
MRRLVEDLLYLGRIEAGEVLLAQEPLDLSDLARAIESRFAFRAQEAGLHLSVRAPEAISIKGDPHRLAQMLDNLVENAFKHTPIGGRIDVSVTREPNRGNTGGRSSRHTPMAIVSVHNSGSYIPPAEAERVFERFYQIDKARAGSNGRGLGLAIASEIVQAHRGNISLVSTPDAGTTFNVRLPYLEMPSYPLLISPEPARPAEVGAARR